MRRVHPSVHMCRQIGHKMKHAENKYSDDIISFLLFLCSHVFVQVHGKKINHSPVTTFLFIPLGFTHANESKSECESIFHTTNGFIGGTLIFRSLISFK